MRIRLTLSALVVVLLAAAPAAWAAGSDTAATDDSGTTIHLVERAERTMPRDRLTATLHIEVTGRDPSLVQKEGNRRMQDALSQARAAPSVKVASGDYSVYRQAPTTPNASAPDKWVAGQTMNLTSTDFAAALALIGALQSDGLVIESLGFDVAPETLRAAQDAMTDEALAALRARAARVAAAMGMTVVRYKSLDVGNVTTQEIRRPMPLRMMQANASAPSAPPPAAAEAGESTAWLAVDAQVILGSKKAP